MIFENNDNNDKTYNNFIVYSYTTKKTEIYKMDISYKIGKYEKSNQKNQKNHFQKKTKSSKKKIL